MISRATWTVPMTMIVLNRFGMMWRNIMRQVPSPITRAAAMYSSDLMRSTSNLMTRV